MLGIDNNTTNSIRLALSRLINEEFCGIGRGADMLWICFGEDVSYISTRGKHMVKSKYGIHVQCNWEIRDNDRIILNQDDFYIPKDDQCCQVFDIESFGNSRFDELASKFNTTIKDTPVYVVSFEVDMTGGFSLRLSNSYMIKVIANSPSEGESWRFLILGSEEEHLVLFTSDE